jgi:threonine synthase
MSLVKTWKGFNELRAIGWVDRLPMMTAVQAARCAPIVESWKNGLPRVAPVDKQSTIASALAAADPGLLGDQTLAAIRASNGAAVGVEEADIIEAVRLLGQEGLMIEPSGAVTVAAVRRGVQEGTIGRDESVVCILTGSGFKDFDRILDLVEIPQQVVSGFEGHAGRSRADRLTPWPPPLPRAHGSKHAWPSWGSSCRSSRRPWATTCPRPGWGTWSTPRGRRRGSTGRAAMWAWLATT